jgi:hypothetical protein
MDRISVTIASDVDRDLLLGELWVGEEMWGEISLDESAEAFTLRVFPPASGKALQFDLSAVEEAIATVKKKLWQLHTKSD